MRPLPSTTANRVALALLGTGALALMCLPPSARADGAPPDDSGPTDEIVVTARHLADIRNGIDTQVGASSYKLDLQSIDAQPGGENLGLNDLVLQAPGVAQDSFGQLHIRGEHNNLQYRLNGIILPEGISVFGQTLNPRLAESVDLITGALPAEYGLRTAGIIDIQTKAGTFDEGGEVGVYGGSHGQIQPSFEYGGSIGTVNYFVSGSYLGSGLGIESPDGSATPHHDQTDQGQGFAYVEDILDASSKLTLILGTSREQFEIPDLAGQTPALGLDVAGRTGYPSLWLNENQREITDYGVVSYLRTSDRLDVQASVFGRYSSLYYTPDVTGDLLYDGLSQNAYKRDISIGTQDEAVYRLTDTHTLRAGVIVEGDRATSDTLSEVMPTNAAGIETSDVPVSIPETGGKTAWEYSIYLQDEWKILPDLTVNYGGRFDLVDAYDHENQASPRFNLVWQPDAATTIHAGYARYFTPPPFELVGGESIGKFLGTSAAPSVSADATPRAEKANYFDIGISEKLLPGLTAGLDTYYKNSRDLIDEGQFGAPIILTPFNYASGRQYGVELTVSYQHGPLSTYGNLAVGVAEGKDIVTSQFNFTAAELAYIADNYIHLDHDQTYTASAGAAYRWQGAQFSLDMIYGSGLRADSDHPNGATLPGYVQVNFGITRGFDLPYAGTVKLRFDVINLFDEVYEIRNGTGVGVGAPQYGPRRGFFFGVAREF